MYETTGTISEKGKLLKLEQFANKRDKVTTKVKSKAALAAGFLLPIAAELGYRPIKETLERVNLCQLITCQMKP
jgi:hypothetical protein